jgi:hypothetical protein
MYVLQIVVCPFVLFFCPLSCLFFFDLRILITPLVSSNSSCIKFQGCISSYVIFRMVGTKYNSSICIIVSQEHAIQWPKEPRIETSTYNTMAKKKMTNGQFMIYKTLHRKLKICPLCIKINTLYYIRCYSASSLKQQFAGRQVAPLGH